MKMKFSKLEFILWYFKARHAMTVCLLPDVGVVLQAQQRMFRVIENTLLDAQFGPGGAADGWLSGGCVFNRETGTYVTNGDCPDVSCNITTMQKRWVWKLWLTSMTIGQIWDTLFGLSFTTTTIYLPNDMNRNTYWMFWAQRHVSFTHVMPT